MSKEKQAKWEYYPDIDGLIDHVRCSNCGGYAPVQIVGVTWGFTKPDKCPNCGAKMQEVEE